MKTDIVQARVLVSGTVQGVFFRSETRDTARRLGLDGWVRNLPGGDVEAVFAGPRHLVEQAVEWTRGGPPHARVESLRVTWEEPSCESGFSVRY